MSEIVVLGAGLVGSHLATLLADRGDAVALVSLSGRGPSHPLVRRVGADVTADLLTVQRRPAAILNCLNPTSYTRWSELWPPIQAATVDYARTTGAPLVTASNLYPYGPAAGRLHPGLPDRPEGKKALVRAQMWAEVKELHERGELRGAEVRASDYVAPGEQSPLGERFVPALLAGRKPSIVGRADVPHSWTAPVDVARTLMAVMDDPASWGRVWHVPTNEPRTFAQAAEDVARIARITNPGVAAMPRLAFEAAALFVPIVRELRETLYQFESAFVIDDDETRTRWGLAPTAWDDLLADLVGHYRPAS